MLPIFIRYINDKWLWECAEKYFKERDPVALNYLPKLLGKPENNNEKKILLFGDAISKIAQAGKPEE